MNEQNLIPNSQRTPSELREQTRKGGIASGKARLRKKHGEELVRALLAMKEPDPKVIATLEAAGIDPKDITREVAMHYRQIEKATKTGDTFAYNAVNKASGYLVEKVEHTGEVRSAIIVESKEQKDAIEALGELGV